MSKSFLLLLIISLFLSSLVISDDSISNLSSSEHSSGSSKQIKCEKTPNIEDCIDIEYGSTCAYYKEDCPFEVCGRESGNWCYACADNTTLYYKNEACKPEDTVAECFEEPCNTYYDEQVDQVFEPVCGIQDGGKKKKTFNNTCKACSAKNYDWYQVGPCQKDRHTCKESERSKGCDKRYSPVCAHAKVEDNSTQFTTAANGCTACADPAVEYYIKGECGPLRDNATYCLPNTRPQACTYEYVPVCGFYLNETSNTFEHKVLPNACAACSDSDIIYHIPGPCVFTCNRPQGVVVECIGSTVEPICGTYEENGQKVNVSLKNSCIGCYYAPNNILIDTYVDGLCPGDEGIYCSNDAGGFLQGIISPVCGLTEEGCDDDSCWTSFSEPLFACADNTTLLFNKGFCPGDEGLSCRPFREGFVNEENESYLSGINYGEVCGYTELGCDDNSCRSTYTNQTVACNDESVIFFTGGACLA